MCCVTLISPSTNAIFWPPDPPVPASILFVRFQTRCRSLFVSLSLSFSSDASMKAKRENLGMEVLSEFEDVYLLVVSLNEVSFH